MKVKLLPVGLIVALAGSLLGCKPKEGQGGSSDTAASRSERQSSVTATDSNLNSAYGESAGKNVNKPADNTGRNVRDRSDATLTPGDQGNSESDREMTRGIRRAVTGNDQLSTTAKNVKIITVNGKVTLRGVVKTPEEKAAIEQAARGAAGAAEVDNQLEVKSNQ